MKRVVTASLAVILLSACAAIIPTDYVGKDAGYAVMGIGSVLDSPYDFHEFTFRRVGEQATGRLFYNPKTAVPVNGRRDYQTSEEAGAVEVASLPAGRYELVNFRASLTLLGTVQFSAQREFSIPFEVRPNEVVYLGNYQANPIRNRTSSGRVVAGGTYFVVEDRSRRDLQLAKARLPSLPIERMRNATPDVRQMRNPLFVPVRKPTMAESASARRL